MPALTWGAQIHQGTYYISKLHKDWQNFLSGSGIRLKLTTQGWLKKEVLASATQSVATALDLQFLEPLPQDHVAMTASSIPTR